MKAKEKNSGSTYFFSNISIYATVTPFIITMKEVSIDFAGKFEKLLHNRRTGRCT